MMFFIQGSSNKYWIGSMFLTLVKMRIGMNQRTGNDNFTRFTDRQKQRKHTHTHTHTHSFSLSHREREREREQFVA